MIDRNMAIEDVVRRNPQTVPVFERHGLGCLGCRAALFESIEQGAKIHGVDVEALIADLNEAIPGG
jgi:hybrid cluster-associated redox disulfide protein